MATWAHGQMTQAIIDLGTNTFNLLVFEHGAAGLRILHSSELPVFLGKGGIEKGVINEDAFARGLEALARHKATAAASGALKIRGFGTSALRNARNGRDFVDHALQELGIPIDIIPGDEEASLILDGVKQAVELTARPALIMDIGGGSIEFILATNKALMWKRSFELGVTRLRERIPMSEPITVEEEARLAAHLDDRLEPLWAVIERHEPHTLIGSAGSFDTLAAMVRATRDGDGIADASQEQHTTLDFTALEFDGLREGLLRMTRTEREHTPGLPPHRVDTIVYALIAIERVLTAGGIRHLTWSRYALKEGAAARMVQDHGIC